MTSWDGTGDGNTNCVPLLSRHIDIEICLHVGYTHTTNILYFFAELMNTRIVNDPSAFGATIIALTLGKEINGLGHGPTIYALEGLRSASLRWGPYPKPLELPLTR